MSSADSMMEPFYISFTPGFALLAPLAKRLDNKYINIFGERKNMSLDRVNAGVADHAHSLESESSTDADGGSVEAGTASPVNRTAALDAHPQPTEAVAGDGFHHTSEPILPADVQKTLLLAHFVPPAEGGGGATETSRSAVTLVRGETTYSTADTDSGAHATYETDSPTAPDIRHDNGFLQNPSDPADSEPIATREPTPDELTAFATAQLKAAAALTAVDANLSKAFTPDSLDHYLDLPDGIRAYSHFLNGNGADKQFSYDKFVNDDYSGKAVLSNAINDTQRGAEDIYRQMLVNDPSLAGQPVTFEITGSPIRVGAEGSLSFPAPTTENWQKAIGRHTIWNSATVTVTPPAHPGDRPTFSMQYTLHAEDRYNFNRGEHDIATRQPDADNGRFEATGLAHQYMHYGSLSRDVTWTGGSIPGGTEVTGVPD